MANSQGSLKYLHTELCALSWFSHYKQDQRAPSSRLDLDTGLSSPYVIKINARSKPTSHKKGQSWDSVCACFMTAHHSKYIGKHVGLQYAQVLLIYNLLKHLLHFLWQSFPPHSFLLLPHEPFLLYQSTNDSVQIKTSLSLSYSGLLCRCT